MMYREISTSLARLGGSHANEVFGFGSREGIGGEVQGDGTDLSRRDFITLSFRSIYTPSTLASFSGPRGPNQGGTI